MAKAAKKKKALIPIIFFVLLAVGLALFFTQKNQPLKPYSVKVYFLKGGKLAPVERIVNEKVGPMVIAAQTLSKGPTPAEIRQGYYTEIPKGANILSVDKIGSMAIIDFNSALENYGGGAIKVQGLIGQVVYSFTEIPGISEVKITVNGKEEVLLGGEGYVIDKPLSREDVSF